MACAAIWFGLSLPASGRTGAARLVSDTWQMFCAKRACLCISRLGKADQATNVFKDTMVAVMRHICVQHTVCACIDLLCSSDMPKAILGCKACEVRFTGKLSHLHQSSQSIPTKVMAFGLVVACSGLL